MSASKDSFPPGRFLFYGFSHTTADLVIVCKIGNRVGDGVFVRKIGNRAEEASSFSIKSSKVFFRRKLN